MTKDGEMCWTTPAREDRPFDASTTNDKGKKLTVTRVAYMPAVDAKVSLEPAEAAYFPA